MPRAGLDQAAVIERGADLLDSCGPQGLNLAAVADSFGVRVPSLYKHVDGMPGLRRGITLSAKTDLARAIGQAVAGTTQDAAVTALASAYRRWALAHPGQYPTTVRAPVPGDEQDAAVSAALLEVVLGVLAGYDLHGDDAIDATRFLRSALHGFVALETSDAFELPVDLQRSWDRLVASVATALDGWRS